MATLDVVTYPQATLRKISEPITEIGQDIHDLIRDMRETMYGSRGIGLAAPQVGVNRQVIVVDVGAQQLNVRDTAGVIGTTVLFRAEEGTIFNVVDGPQQVDGLLWWKIQAPNNTARTGWAASNYLQIRPGS